MNLKRTNKFYYLFLLAGVVLTFSGANTVNQIALIERNQVSFTKTTYDFIAIKPSADQLESFKNNPIVSDVMPAYNFQVNLQYAGLIKETFLLGVSDINRKEETFFPKSLLINGSHDTSELILDRIAAERLGVTVGKSVSFVANQESFSMEVGAIYEKNQVYLNSGVGMFLMSNALLQRMHMIAYDLVFLNVSEVDTFAQTNTTYKPLGMLISETQYVNNYKSENIKPTNLSDDEWHQQIVNAYNVYRDQFYASEYPGYFQNKNSISVAIVNSNAIAQQNSALRFIEITIGVFIALFSLIILMVKLDEKWQHDLILNGTSNLTLFFEYLIKILLGSVSLLGFLIITIYLTGIILGLNELVSLLILGPYTSIIFFLIGLLILISSLIIAFFLKLFKLR